jgi:hypothetical protein
MSAPPSIFAAGADVVPSAPLPEKGSGRPPATTPEHPSEEGTPAIPPSTIDPGIQKRPPTTPDARSAVPPPTVDPKMSVDPETAPPAEKAKKRPGSERHEAPPVVKWSADRPDEAFVFRLSNKMFSAHAEHEQDGSANESACRIAEFHRVVERGDGSRRLCATVEKSILPAGPDPHLRRAVGSKHWGTVIDRVLRRSRFALRKGRSITRHHQQALRSKHAGPFFQLEQARMLSEATELIENVPMFKRKGSIAFTEIGGKNSQSVEKLRSQKRGAPVTAAPLQYLWKDAQY